MSSRESAWDSSGKERPQKDKGRGCRAYFTPLWIPSSSTGKEMVRSVFLRFAWS